MPSKLPTETVHEIVKLYLFGYGTTRISRQLGISEHTVRKILRGQCRTEITGGRLMQGIRPKRELAKAESCEK